jgi:hypothetical protein
MTLSPAVSVPFSFLYVCFVVWMVCSVGARFILVRTECPYIQYSRVLDGRKITLYTMTIIWFEQSVVVIQSELILKIPAKSQLNPDLVYVFYHG